MGLTEFSKVIITRLINSRNLSSWVDTFSPTNSCWIQWSLLFCFESKTNLFLFYSVMGTKKLVLKSLFSWRILSRLAWNDILILSVHISSYRPEYNATTRINRCCLDSEIGHWIKDVHKSQDLISIWQITFQTFEI